MWPEGGEKVFIPWHEASIFVPPNRWFHQHFNVSDSTDRYLAFHAPRGANETSERVEDLARDQIEYPAEDPIIRETFERDFARRGSSEKVQRLRAELAASGLRESDPEAYRQRNFELSVAGYFHDPDGAVDPTPFRVSSRVQQSVWDSLGDFDLASDGTLARIDLPTLIVHGRQDPIPLASSAEAARVMGATLVSIDDCGHVPYVEQPAALFEAIGRFLRHQS